LPLPLFSLAERRALRGVGPALTNTGTPAVAAVAPVGRPAITSSSSMRKVGALGGAASASAGSALPVPRSATASLPPRSDWPVIKRASARGSNDLEGECIDGDGSLIDVVYQDMKAACGKGVRSSHLATGPSHHYHLVPYDTNWAKARSLQGRSDDAILVKTLVSRWLPLADLAAALITFLNTFRDSLSEQRVSP